MPPARRPITSQPTVAGAPFDPAIISSQMAKPDSNAGTPQQAASTSISPAQGPSTISETQLAATESSGRPSQSASPSRQTDTSVTPLAANTGSVTSTVASPTAVAESARDNATATVEADTYNAFKKFAAHEKSRLSERQRAQRNADKQLKINDLKKFSSNFKLSTPVPTDLVPILAKDKIKQEEIIAKAKQQAEDQSTKSAPTSVPATPKGGTPATDPKGPRPTARYDSGVVSPTGPSDRHGPGRRQGYPTGPHGPMTTRADRNFGSASTHRAGPVPLSARLADIQSQRKNGVQPNVPAPLPIQDGRVSNNSFDQSGVSSPRKMPPTPTSATSTKLNINAMEFKPNVAAPAFAPAGPAATAAGPTILPSPNNAPKAPVVTRSASPSQFFGARKPKPASERPSLADSFNPIKRMKKEVEEQKLDYKFNGGIPPAYKTEIRWETTKENENKTYNDLFEKVPLPNQSVSPQSRSASNGQIPHQHQLPLHLQQNVPPMQPHHPGHHMHQQHHPAGPQHFEDHHRMHLSHSSASVYQSPRLQNSHMAHPSPMTYNAQMGGYGRPVPFVMGPNGPQQQHHMGQFPGGPAFVGPQQGAPMMVHQNSQGGYMAPMPPGMPYNQAMMQSPNPAYAFPQHVAPPQPHSGYPSPSRGAPMMLHQGSQQGQHPQQMMYMNPQHGGQPMYGHPGAHGKS